MKNKKVTYVLILFVLVVWGIIVYRLFSAMNSNDDDAPFTGRVEMKESYNDFTIKKDTGSLSLKYRDPFGSIVKDTVEKPVIKPVTSKIINTVTKPATNWNIIKYSGYIRNPNSKKLIAIMNINGKTILLSEGESADQVKLLKNLKDSVKVSYKNQTKFISVNGAAL